MSFFIEIRDESPSKLRISHSKIKKTAIAVLKALGWKQAALSLYLVSDRKIRSLNKKYLGHDWPTDVISFSQWEGRKIPVKGMTPLGDLIISLDTTARQAAEYGNDFFYEFAFYLCHGILHLMGYEDQTLKDAKGMERKQTMVLKKIGINSGIAHGAKRIAKQRKNRIN